MIIADSSFVVGELLSGGTELAGETMVIPDLAIHEVVNALYVQERVLHRIPDGLPYIRLMFEAIDSGMIAVVRSSERLVQGAYEMAARTGSAVYDCVFVFVALSAGQELRTYDKKQMRLFESEAARGTHHGSGSHSDGSERQ